jgi:hypothetical protein
VSQQTYPVKCECGKVHRVTSGLAGGTLACGCGKVVPVPAYSVLRTLVADEFTSPEVELDARSRLGQLPMETRCVLCEVRTEGVVPLRLCTESPTVPDTVPILAQVVTLPFGSVAQRIGEMVADAHTSNAAPLGDSVAYELPVRVCPACHPRLARREVAEAALRKTKVYARLLRKYSAAQLLLPSGQPIRFSPVPPHIRHRKARRVALAWVAGLLSTFAAVVTFMFTLNAVPALKSKDGTMALFVLGGLFLVPPLFGTGVGILVNRWHRRRWPES